jgi:tRNA nucleotidyltransferase (CCA-adding enzyme)
MKLLCMGSVNSVLKEALDEIKPREPDEANISEATKFIISKIQKYLKKGDAKVILGGSGAKGTWLRNSYDADIFVLFNYTKYSERSAELSNILEKYVKKAFKGKRISRVRGSRDYFQIDHAKSTFEIVPILGIKHAEDAKNITDVSPLHADWVNRSSNDKLKDEIRLAKQFCKANELYGAESYIQGFSGYVLEVFVVHYGSFLKFLRAVVKWPKNITEGYDKVVIDPTKHYKNKNDVLFSLNKSKTFSPLIIIDPVQKDRNAAAALGYEKYVQFINLAGDFLKKLTKEFFEIKEVTLEDLKQKESKTREVYVLEVVPKSGKRDVVGAKLMKAFEAVKREIGDTGFKLHDAGWSWDKKKNVLFWFVVNKKKLEAVVVHAGPPIKMKHGARKFEAKYKNSFVKKGKLFAKIRRKYLDVSKLLRDLANDKYVKQRVKSIKYNG